MEILSRWSSTDAHIILFCAAKPLPIISDEEPNIIRVCITTIYAYNVCHDFVDNDHICPKSFAYSLYYSHRTFKTDHRSRLFLSRLHWQGKPFSFFNTILKIENMNILAGTLWITSFS